MNVAVRDVRVDPMFVSLVRAHGFTPQSREIAKNLLAPREKPKRAYRRNLNEWHAVRCPWPCYADSGMHAGLIPRESAPRITVKDIIDVVSDLSGVTPNDILSMRRDAKSCLARHIAMYLAKKLTVHSLPRIGKLMGGKDHTTVLHGIRRIQAMLDAGNESLSEFLTKAGAKLEGGN